jgi:glycine cleavage system pyridoxal-binding protein P
LTRSLSRTCSSNAAALLAAKDRFAERHLGPRDSDLPSMLETIGAASVDEMIEKTVPPSILLQRPLDLGEYSEGLSESMRWLRSKRWCQRTR